MRFGEQAIDALVSLATTAEDWERWETENGWSHGPTMYDQDQERG